MTDRRCSLYDCIILVSWTCLLAGKAFLFGLAGSRREKDSLLRRPPYIYYEYEPEFWMCTILGFTRGCDFSLHTPYCDLGYGMVLVPSLFICANLFYHTTGKVIWTLIYNTIVLHHSWLTSRKKRTKGALNLRTSCGCLGGVQNNK